MTHLTKLVRYSTWANEAWIAFIDEKRRSDEFLQKRISHILHGERIWFQRIAGEPIDREIWTILDVGQQRALLARNRELSDACLAGDLNRIVAYTRLTGEQYRSPVADILLHLTLHGAHHRGQMATHTSAQGLPPINTDYVQYCLTAGL